MQHRHILTKLVLAILLLFSFSGGAYDDIHPFRPLPFSGETRLSTPQLTSYALSCSHGTSDTWFTDEGNTAPLCPPLNNFKFSVTEITIHLWHNLEQGFFLAGYLPLREISLTSPTASSIDQACHTYIRQGFGDIAGSLGWTMNQEETTTLDFLDVTVIGGIVFPSSKTIHRNGSHDFPLGYNGAFGLYVEGATALGLFDWLTLGCHTQLLMLSDPAPCTQECTGTPGLSGSWYAKADHILCGFSMLIGGSTVWQNGARGSSPIPATWSQHSVHYSLEYDGATFTQPYAPRIALACSTCYAGSNALRMTTYGYTWDVTINWNF